MICRRGSPLSYLIVLVCGIFGTLYIQQGNYVSPSVTRERTLPQELRENQDSVLSHLEIQNVGEKKSLSDINVNQMKPNDDQKHRRYVKDDDVRYPGGPPGSQDKHQVPKTTGPEDPFMPKVYMYRDGSLDHIPNFCKWTPEFLCAKMITETGRMPVYIHNIPKTDTSTVSGALLNEGVWEKKIVDVFLDQLKKFPEAGVLDFGCNVGSFTFLAARAGRKVVAVDAVTDNMLKVCKTTVKNNLTKQVLMVVNALYEDHRTVVFETKNTHTYELAKIIERYNHKEESVCEENTKVQTVMMDDLLAIIPFKTAVMKIDVESFEYFAFQGGKKFFKEIDIKAIVMEWYHVARTSKVKLLLNMLLDFGYIPYTVPTSGRPRKLDYSQYHSWTHDVLFLKP